MDVPQECFEECFEGQQSSQAFNGILCRFARGEWGYSFNRASAAHVFEWKVRTFLCRAQGLWQEHGSLCEALGMLHIEPTKKANYKPEWGYSADVDKPPALEEVEDFMARSGSPTVTQKVPYQHLL